MYECNLTTYIVPPFELCSVFEIEQLCEERLQLYKIMDEAHDLDYKANSKKWENYVENQIVHRKLRTYFTLLKTEEWIVGQTKAKRNNNIAHWILSLCYCQSRLLRNFFINCELHWFIMLYKRMKKGNLQHFFIQNEIKYECINQYEKNAIKHQLLQCRPIKESNFASTIYYKIKFSEVCNLVTIRKVFLHKGYAYFPENDLIFCIKEKLWRQFNKQLLWNNKMLPVKIHEDRLKNILNHLPLVKPTYRRFSDKEVMINGQNIDEMAEIHFPLCMKAIHAVLREEHHLKYDCKMQYGIFLKWVGLSYQQAMEFWKSEFTKKMSSEWFDRKYSYLFKHQYGKVGGLIQYNPYTCEKILSSRPGPGQFHGCPFKHWDLKNLLQFCQNEGFSTENINDLKSLVISKKYKEACTIYFNITHKVCTNDIIKSPNQYFETSYEFENSLNMCLNKIFDDCDSQDCID